MKLIIVLMIATLSLTYCTPTGTQQQFAKENQRFFDILSGIGGVINQLVESVNSSLNNLWGQTQTWIQNEISEVENAIANGITAFNQYIAQAQEEMDALINGQVVPCLNGVIERIQLARDETTNAINICHANGRDKLSTISQDIENYQKTKRESIEGMQAFIQFCVNEPSFGDKIKCAVDASRNISSTIGVLRENIANTTTIINAKINQVAQETHECVANELRQGQEKIQVILEDVRQCLEDAGTTTTAAQTTESNRDNSNTNAEP